MAGPAEPAGDPRCYEAFGRSYRVLDTAEGYVERGVASWYGDEFQGNATANGETFDMFALTAAHRTLPIPTEVEVTNLRNGKSIVVRINDRGPYLGGRIIDLSYAAARALDLVAAGTGRVEVRALPAGAVSRRRAPARTAKPTVFLQVGAYHESANAERMRVRLEGSGFRDVAVRERSLQGRRLVQVRLGPIESETACEGLLGRLARMGIADAFLVPEFAARSQVP